MSPLNAQAWLRSAAIAFNASRSLLQTRRDLGSRAVLVAAALLIGCSDGGEPARPNILLISVDTLRADHLGYHGYVRDTSPYLDQLAGEALTYLDASVQVPKTAPSIASIFTSRYPVSNAVESNHHRIPDGRLTLAELLRASGYQTVAYTTNANLTEKQGFFQGFDEAEYLQHPRNAAQVTDRAIARLEQGFKGPFFLWLHYVDPHGPYMPPAPHDLHFVDDEHYDATARVEHEYQPLPGYNENYVLGAVPRYAWRPLRKDPRNAERDYYVARYDGEIRYLDRQLERLAEYLDDAGLTEKTVLAFTADHGEGLGEHDYYFEHGWFAYQHQIHVPLILRVPGGPTGRVDRPVELIDLTPTLLELAEVAAPPESVQGESLLAPRDSSRSRDLSYSQTPTEEYPHQYRSVRRENWKYIVDRRGNEQLFDLLDDPDELDNVASDHTELVESFREDLARGPWNDSPSEAAQSVEPSELSDEARDHLKALGYID